MHNLHYAHLVLPAAGDINVTGWSRGHIADYTASGGNRPGLKDFRLRIEAHYGIRLNAGFRVPHNFIRRYGYTVRRLHPGY